MSEQLTLIEVAEQEENYKNQLIADAEELFSKYADDPLICNEFHYAVSGGVHIKIVSQFFTDEEVRVYEGLADVERRTSSEEPILREQFSERNPLTADTDIDQWYEDFHQTLEYLDLFERMKNTADARHKIECIGWIRYINSRSYEDILSDLREIFSISYTDHLNIDSNKVSVPYSAVGIYNTQIFDGILMIEAGKYQAKKVADRGDYVLSSFSDYTYMMMRALEEQNLPTSDANIIIRDSIADVQKHLSEDFEIDTDRDDAPAVSLSPSDQYYYPLDPVSNKLWGKSEYLTGMFNVPTTSERDRKKDDDNDRAIGLLIETALSDEEVAITKPLSAFDKQVQIVVAGLYNAGNDIVTLSQIHKSMTGKSPNSRQLEKINDSITKMSQTFIYINLEKDYPNYNKDAYTKRGKDGKLHSIYDGSLMPMERVTAIVDGKITDSAIHLFREPPLISFARDRQQFTTIKANTYRIRNLAENNLTVRDYLIRRIAHMKRSASAGKKNKKLSNRIKFESLYKNTGLTSAMERSRAVETMDKCLAEFKQTGYIKGYKFEFDNRGKDSVLIFVE